MDWNKITVKKVIEYEALDLWQSRSTAAFNDGGLMLISVSGIKSVKNHIVGWRIYSRLLYSEQQLK
jgi:hypothetical protein